MIRKLNLNYYFLKNLPIGSEMIIKRECNDDKIESFFKTDIDRFDGKYAYFNNNSIDIDWNNNCLNSSMYGKNVILEIRVPINYKYYKINGPKKTKKMTLDEISKELGYNVKIIKGR